MIGLAQATELVTDRSEAFIKTTLPRVYHRVPRLTKLRIYGIMTMLHVVLCSIILLSYDREVMPMDYCSITGAVASPQIIE